ncbi:MAG: autotransporter-associated beta strand repeat-containing protein [Prosthecobacter sp.]
MMIVLMLTWQVGQPLRAATFIWTDATGNTSVGGNWLGGTSPNAISVAGDILNLNNALTAPRTVTLDGLVTAGTLNIGDTTTTNAFTLAAGTGGYLTLDAISGNAAISKTGDGLDTISTGLQFNDALAITNSTGTGTLTLSGALRSLTSDISFNGTGAVATGSIVVSGAISTAGNLVKNDAGITRLSGANTYAGTTTINGGTLQISNAAALPARSAVTVAAGATLDYLDTATTIGSLSGAGTINNSTATAARILTIGRDDTSTSFTGRFLPTTIARMAITKIGAGTLTLAPSLASTYTGATVVNGGAINLDFANTALTSLLAATPMTIAGGNFTMTGKAGLAANQLLGALTVGATGGSISLVAGDASGTTLRTGAVTATASGGALLITAPANTIFQMGTSYTATTLNNRIVFSDGTANTFNWAVNTGANTTTTAFGTYTALPIVGGGANTTAYNLTASQTQTTAAFVGRSVKLGSTLGSAQTWDLAAFNATLGGTATASPGAILIDGTDAWNINGGTGVLGQATVAGGDLIFHQYNTTNAVTVNAGIANGAGTLNLVKAGPGTLVLAGTNTFTGTVFVDGGTLSFSNVAAAGAGSLGNGSATAVTIRDGATLQYTGAAGTIVATGAGGHTYVLQGGQGTIEVTNAVQLDLNGVISGAGGLTKTGAGTLNIGASSTFTGPLIINQGTLRAGGNFQISSGTSPVTIGASGTLDINGTAANLTTTVGSLTGSGIVLNNGASGKTLSVGGDNTSTTFSGTFAAGATASNILTKAGSGIMTLTNAATSAWTGGNNVAGGVLRLGASNTLNTTGTMNVGTTAGLAALELGAGFNQTLAGITFYGTNSAATTQGTVLIGTGSTLTSGSITVNNNNNPLGAVISGAGILSLGGANRNINVLDSSTVVPTAAELTISTPIASVGAFGITKQGVGNLLLSGNNTYTGATTIGGAGGTTTLSGDNTATTGAVTLNSATLILDYASNPTTRKMGSGLFSALGGTLVLNGNASTASLETITGNTTFAAGGRVSMTLNSGGQDLALNLGTLTRAAGAGTVRFNLPTGTQTGTHGILTSTTADANTGLLGSVASTGAAWATVTDATGTFFATKSGNNIVAVSTTTQNDVTLWTSGQNLSDSTAGGGFTGTVPDCLSINSLRFDATGPSTVTLAGAEMLRIASGGVLQTSNVTTGVSTITGGTLSSGTGELIFTTDGTQRLDVTSQITATSAITKTGNGTLRLTGANSATGAVSIQAGTLELTGGSALGDTAVVTLASLGGGTPTLRLLANQTETIGSLTGGQTTNTSAAVSLGASSTLTINQGADLNYTGALIGDGTTTLVKSGAFALTLDNTSAGFTGALRIDQGQVTLSGNLGNLTGLNSVVLNGAGTLRLNYADNNNGDRLRDLATVTLNNTISAAGGGLRMNNTSGTSRSETMGALTLGAGHNSLWVDGTNGGNFTTTMTFASLAANNRATSLVVGRSLGTLTAANESRIIFTTAPTAIGGGGLAGTTNISIVPHLIGESTTGAPTSANVGNSFVSLGDGTNGVRPLNLTSEYLVDQAAPATGANNLRYTASNAITTPAVINALALDSGSAIALTGSASSMDIGSGAILAAGAGAHSIASITGLTTTAATYYTYVTNSAGSLTLTTPLTTAVPLAKSGAGTLILGSASNAFTELYLNQGVVQADALNKLGTGSLNFFGGTLRFTGAFDPSSRTINLGTGGGTFDTNGETITLAGSVGAGVGGLTKTGAGDLILNGASTYTGATSVLRGGLTLGNNTAISTGNLTLESTLGAVTLDIGSQTITVADLNSSGANTIAINGSGTINANNLNLAAAAVQNTVVFGGAANLIKSGTTTTTLNNSASTFTGYTWIQDGTLSINNVANAGSNSALGAATGANAEIRLGNLTTTGVFLFTGAADSTDRSFGLYGTTGGGTIDNDGTGALSLSGNIEVRELGAKTLTFQGTAGTLVAPNVFSGIIDQCLSVLTVTKAEAGVWSFTNANSYTGNTNVNAGTLIVGNNSALGTGILNLNAGTLQGDGTARTLANTVLLSNSSTLGGTSNLTFSGGFTQTGGDRTLTVSNTGVTNFNGSFALDRGATNGVVTVSPGAGAVVNIANLQDGAGAGTGGLTKSGVGTLNIANAFTIGGGLIVNGATSSVVNLTGLGTTTVSGNLDVANAVSNNADLIYGVSGATLSVGSGSSNQVRFGLAGADGTADATVNFAGLQQFNANVGNFLVGTATAGSTVTVNANVTLATNNNITAATAFTVSNSPAPGLTGTVSLTLGSGTNIITTPTMTLVGLKGSTTGTTVTLPGGTLTINAGAGPLPTDLYVARNNVSTGTTPVGTVDFTAGVVTGTFDDFFVGEKSAGGAGSSTGTISFGSGANAITANTVKIGDNSGGTGGAGTGTVNLAGGTFAVANDIALATLTSTGAATARGTLNLTGGTTTVAGNITKTSSANSTGTIILAGGTLDMTSGTITSSQLAYRSGTLSNVTGITLDAHATTTGTGNTADALIVRDVSISAPITLTGATASNIRYENNGAGAGATLSSSLDLGSANRVFNIEDSAGSTIELTHSGALTAAGGLTKSGAGVLALTGTTTSFTGNTSVQNGRLILAGTVNNRLGTTGSLTVGDSTNSGVIQLGDGTGISNQTFTALATSGNGTANAIFGGAATHSTLTVNQSTNTVYAGALGGVGTNENNLNLVKSGSGELSLTGVNTYTGSTTVSGGRLLINSTTGLPATISSLTVDDGAELFLRATNPAANVVYGFSGGAGNKITVGTTTGATLGFALDGAFNSQLFLAAGQTMALTGTLTTKVEIINTPNDLQDYILINGTDPSSLGATGTFSLSPTIINGGSFTYTLRRETNLGTNDQWIITPAAQPAAADVWWRGDLSGGGLGVWAASTTNPGNETNWDTTLGGGADALVPPDRGSHVHFSASSAGNFATTLGANLTIKKLTFESGSITSGVTVGGANTLTVGHSINGAGTADITVAAGAGTGAITISAPVALGIAQSVNVVDNTSILAFTGGISGGQALTINDAVGSLGTVRIGTVSATYTGATTVAAGRLVLDGTNRLPTTTALTLGNASTAATLQLGNGAGASNTAIGNLANGAFAGNTIVGGDALVSTLSVTQGAAGSFDGVIGGGGANENNVALTKTGTATLTLNGANTYTGGTIVSNGTLQLGATGSITGALTVSALAGVTATFDNNSRPTILTGGITLGGADAAATPTIINTGGTGSITLGGNVLYDGTNNPLGGSIAAPLDLGTAARTFTANDSATATTDLAITGAVSSTSGNVGANGIGLILDGTGSGLITGAISLVNGTTDGANADLTKNGIGTWTIQNTVTVGDDYLVNAGVLTVSGAGSLILGTAGDFVADTTAAPVVNFNVANSIVGGGAVGTNRLFARDGSTINLNATNAIGTSMEQIILGDDNQGIGNLVLAAATTNAIPLLQIGFNSAGEQGNISGTGTLSVSTTLTYNNGTVSANLSGAAAATKDNNLTVTLSGINSLTGTTLNREGTLALDFTTNAGTDNKMGTGAFTVGSNTNNDNRAITTLLGNASAASTQTVASLAVAGGPSEINLTAAGGQNITFAVSGALTRTAGTVNVALPNANTILSYSGGTTNNITGANGIVGGWMTINDRDFATISGGQIIAATYATENNAANWGTNANVTNNAGFSGTVGECNTINSLRFDAAGVSTITVDRNLIITSGGILENLSVGNNASTITGGSLISGTGEFIFTQNNTLNTLTVASRIISGATASPNITKNGAGVLVLSGANNLTGTINIDEGTLRLTGGSAVSDTSTINLRNVTGATLELAASQTETIGSLAGDTGGAIILNTGSTLTVNQAAANSVSAVISGAGTLVKSGASTLTLTGTSTASGQLRIDQGTVALTGNVSNLNAITSIVLNGPTSSLRNDQDQNAANTRITNTATVTLNNTAGGAGFAISKTAGNALALSNETVGALTLGAGHNVISATSAIAASGGQWTFASIAATNPNRATTLVRGLALGSDVATQFGKIVFTAAPSGAYAPVGTTVGGNIGTTLNLQILPYFVGDVTAAGFGNTFVTNTGTTNGVRPLAAAEYEANPTAPTAGNNVRYTATTAINTLATINSLVLDSGTAINLTATTPGAMEVTSGAILAAGAANHTIGSSLTLTTGGGRDYTAYVPLAAQSLTMDAALTSVVPLVKSGAGTLSLTNTGNLFTDVYLNQGRVLIDDLDKVNNTTGTLRFFGGGIRVAAGFSDDLSTKVWDINTGGGTIDVSLVTAGTTFVNGLDDSTVNASDTINIATRSIATGSTGQLTIQGASTFTGTTIINHSGISTATAASVILNGSGTAINGNLQIGNVTTGTNDVVVHLGASDQIVDTATLSFVGANGAFSYFKLLGFNETVAGISDTSGAGVIENRETETVSASGTLTLNSSADFSYNGFFRDVNTGAADTNKLILVKQGTGNQTLSGANIRHSGTTTISAGALTLTDVTNWQSAITNNATLNINQTTGSRNHTQVISGSGTINKLGAGTIVIPTATTNTYSGQTNIEQGILSISTSAALGDASATNTLRIANNATLQSTGANVNLTANRSITMAGNGATIEVTGTNTLTAPGGLIGDVCHTLTKTGTGLLVLTDITNGTTFTGATNVSAGILQVGSGGTAGSSGTGESGSGDVTVASGATLAGSGTVTGSTILGAGAVLQAGDVTTAGTAASTITGRATLTFTAAVTADAGSEIRLGLTASTNAMPDPLFGGNLVGSSGYNSYVIANGTGAGNHDRLILTDLSFSASSAVLNVLGETFTPVSGQIFNLLDWSGALTGFSVGTNYRDGASDNSNQFNLPDISASGLVWDVSLFTSNGVIVVVPEPSRALLLLFGLLGLMMRRRRQ